MTTSSMIRSAKAGCMVLAVISGILLGACGGSGSTQTGNLTGSLEVAGGPQGAGQAPTSGTVSFVPQGSAAHVVSVPNSGSFSATLPTGTYTVQATIPTPSGAQAQCLSSPQRVTVTTSAAARVTIGCQVK